MKDLQTVRDAIWVLHEHSVLHNGKNHNTTILSAEAIAIIHQMMQAEPSCPDCKAPDLLYECIHCSASNYPAAPKGTV